MTRQETEFLTHGNMPSTLYGSKASDASDTLNTDIRTEEG